MTRAGTGKGWKECRGLPPKTGGDLGPFQTFSLSILHTESAETRGYGLDICLARLQVWWEKPNRKEWKHYDRYKTNKSIVSERSRDNGNTHLCKKRNRIKREVPYCRTPFIMPFAKNESRYGNNWNKWWNRKRTGKPVLWFFRLSYKKLCCII